MKQKRTIIEQMRDLLYHAGVNGYNKTKLLTKCNFCSQAFDSLAAKMLKHKYLIYYGNKYYLTDEGKLHLELLNKLTKDINFYTNE